ncbi:MAG: hypothetical protein KGJ68_04285 [Gammaproteobacteria bacterium]|nr:hypothetical protein [Gammaproteobacteria bacterium]
MKIVDLPRLYLVAGAFGGEIVLMLALPALGHRYGAAAVALLSVAIAAANAGKLFGCLKIDAAITNAPAEQVALTHAAAVVAAVLAAALLASVIAVGAAVDVLPSVVGTAGATLCVAFLGGAVQQASAMRSLREERLGVFALIKALPSLLVVAIALGVDVGLLSAYQLAFLATIGVAGAVHLRPPRAHGAGLAARTGTVLRAVRPYALYGAPASTLDAANVFFVSVVTLAVAGGDALGRATEVQRIALGPSFAIGMLLSQQLWRERFEQRSHGAALASYHRAAGFAAAGGLASLLTSAALLATPLGALLVPGLGTGRVAVFACLAPLLAQYIGSPLTVYFFKRERVFRYGMLQVGILLLLALAAVAGVRLPPTGEWRPALLLAFAALTLMLTVTMTRAAVTASEGRR